MKLYILFTCDEWKSQTSRLYKGTFSSISNLKNCLIEMENKEEIELSSGCSWEDFNESWDAERLCEIMKYAFVEEDNLDMIY